MNKNLYTNVKLKKGEMNVYTAGDLTLHAYRTNDPLCDEVFIIEKNGKGVVIEAPCFRENISELSAYLADNGIAPVGLLLSYHMAGASFLPGVPVYATANADAYGHTGGGAALIESFKDAFGESFDPSIFTVTNVIDEGKIEIGGIRFVITQTAEAFDIEIPALGAVYTHMLGHDCHSIVAGAAHADAILHQLAGYMEAGYGLVLTSHYTPEDLKDVETKMAYLMRLKEIATDCENAAQFKDAVRAEYPDYSGENYLDMTAGFFFA